MKNIKYIIIGIFISFIFLFVASIISSTINRNKVIHINEFKGAEASLNNINEKIDTLKVDESCKIALKYMSNRVKSNILTGDVKIKDYYESFYKDDMTYMEYLNYVTSSCKLEHNDELYNKAMSTMIYPNYIKDMYNRSYELHFIDNTYNDNLIDESGTYSTIYNEISVLMDIVKELS